MKHALKMTALAVFVASFGVSAMAADKASTTGGFKIKSEDGNFEAKIGGRIHFDMNYYTNEDDINTTAQNSKNDFFFRRTRLTATGRAYDFKYVIDLGFENSSGGGEVKNNQFFRDVTIGKTVLGNVNARIGQSKPYRGMEELTSSNEILFMERPLATATGIYGTQRTLGVFLDGSGEGYGWGVSAYSPREAKDENASGSGVNARGFIVPLRQNGNLLHLGLSASADRYDTRTVNIGPRIVGREGGLRSGSIITKDAYNEQDTIALEMAARFGALTMQGEYAAASFSDNRGALPITTPPTTTPVLGQPDQDVDTYYVQASYFLTGHTKPYDFKKGVFKSPKVDGKEGALELKARYDHIENKDVSDNEASYYSVGMNYYATPNTRFMLEYTDGETSVGTDKEAAVVTARAQFNF